MGEFSRRDLLSTAVIAGAAMTASAAEATDQVPEPSRAPGVGGSDPVPGDVAREGQNPDLLNPPATDSGTLPNLRFSFADAHLDARYAAAIEEWNFRREFYLSGKGLRLKETSK